MSIPARWSQRVDLWPSKQQCLPDPSFAASVIAASLSSPQGTLSFTQNVGNGFEGTRSGCPLVITGATGTVAKLHGHSSGTAGTQQMLPSIPMSPMPKAYTHRTIHNGQGFWRAFIAFHLEVPSCWRVLSPFLHSSCLYIVKSGLS